MFFERNGLRHGGFALRNVQSNEFVTNLSWNCDSSLLAVTIGDGTSTRGNLSRWRIARRLNRIVEIWSTANYHWYRKQVFTNCSAVCDMLWDVENPMRLYLARGEATAVQKVDLAWCVERSASASNDGLAWVAVVDGGNPVWLVLIFSGRLT